MISPKILALMVMVFLYDLSPIDLIPDFIPGLGNLDDAFLSALAVWIAGKKPSPP